MTDLWIRPKQIFDGHDLRSGWALRVVEGRIDTIALANDIPPNAQVQELPMIVSPGFIDLQVNGGGGVLLNDTPTAQAMTVIVRAHRTFGTVGILPTVISDTTEVLAAAVDAAIAAKNEPGVLGLHIEGPHISEARRGTHAARHLRALDETTIGQVRKLRQAHVPVMITLAPEMASSAQIAALAAMGAVVSIGHSDATADQTRAALNAGAIAATHLFNAMPPMLNRSPGVTGAIINSEAYASLIVDGFHVAEEMIGLAIRARPVPERMFLVSDAMPTVGGLERFTLCGQEVRLEAGKLINTEGSLAGAHLTQAEGLHRLVNNLGIPHAQALRMAVTIPARIMGLESLSKPEGQSLNTMICLNDDFRFCGFLDLNTR